MNERNVRKSWGGYDDSDNTSSSTEPDERRSHEWENEVDSRSGQLFYVRHLPMRQNSQSVPNIYSQSFNSNYSSYRSQNSTGILSRLMRRRQNSKRDRQHPNNYESSENESNLLLVTVSRETVQLSPTEATQDELLPGLDVKFSDRKWIVGGVNPCRGVNYSQEIRAGDEICVINGSSVTAQNFYTLLAVNASKIEIVLGLRRGSVLDTSGRDSVTSEENPGDHTLNGVLFANLEEDSSSEDVMYSYPKDKNVLYPVKGAFYTLYHLLMSMSSMPKSTSVFMHGRLMHVIYYAEDRRILLLAVDGSKLSASEGERLVTDAVRYLLFAHQTLFECFGELGNHRTLDDFFRALFRKIKRGGSCHPGSSLDLLFPAAPTLSVPRDVYLQIDDSLNELETNNILENESERKYMVIGSCYFYKGFVVCNHLQKDDLLDVAVMFRQTYLMDLCRNGVRELVYWKEVFPSSCDRGLSRPSEEPYSAPDGRWFLLIVAMHFSFLVTLLESGGCTERVVGNPGPEAAYVEETQATLKHIVNLGVPQSISKWVRKHTDDVQNTNERMSKLRSGVSSQSLPSFTDNRLSSLQSLDAASMSGTMRRKFSFENVASSSGRISPLSDYEKSLEDSGPVLGRRAERELANEINYHSKMNISDNSDESDLQKEGRQFDRLSDASDFSRNTLRADEGATNLGAGRLEDLLHYVNLDKSEGVMIVRPEDTACLNRLNGLLDNFRRTVYKIQDLFMTPATFNNLQSRDLSNTTLNKSLIAVKEYGILFQMTEKERKTTDESRYWVTGRLVKNPNPREIFVCYHDKTSQNMVELAFRLALLSPR